MEGENVLIPKVKSVVLLFSPSGLFKPKLSKLNPNSTLHRSEGKKAKPGEAFKPKKVLSSPNPALNPASPKIKK